MTDPKYNRQRKYLDGNGYLKKLEVERRYSKTWKGQERTERQQKKRDRSGTCNFCGKEFKFLVSQKPPTCRTCKRKMS